MTGIIIFLVFSGIAAILWIGGQDLIAWLISAGELSAFVFYAFLVAASTGFLSELAGAPQRAAWPYARACDCNSHVTSRSRIKVVLQARRAAGRSSGRTNLSDDDLAP